MLRLALAAVMAVVLVVVARPARADGDTAEALSAEAETARAAGLFERCIEKDRAALAKRDRSSTRAHLIGCAESAGKTVVALKELRVILEGAIAAGDADLADAARRRVEQLVPKLALLTLTVPGSPTDLRLSIDDEPLDVTKVGTPVLLDAGVHRIHAEGALDGAPAVFDETVELGEGDRETFIVALKPRAAEHLTPGQIACMQLAKSDEEVLRCLPARDKPLVVRAALEGSVYADSLSVLILSPAVRVQASSPTNGWTAGAAYVVDVVSAASPDIVSTASPRGHDTRHAVSANGGYKPGRFGASVVAGYGTEADYVSRSAGVALQGDFVEKRFTPRLAWNGALDTIGRGGTPYEVFHHTLVTNEGELGATFVLGPRTVLVAGVTAAFERGDQSKPYRLIPMFAHGVDVAAGASPDEVNAKRLPVRPYEQLPLERDRYAVAARLAQRIGSTTLRLEERLYADSWKNRATTTDLRLLIDAGSSVTFGPHGRFNAQTGATFFHRVYVADLEPNVVVPTFRTTDRELGPLWSVTGGASAWWRFGGDLSLYVSGDALWSHYSESLYTTSRLAGYGTVGIEAVFE